LSATNGTQLKKKKKKKGFFPQRPQQSDQSSQNIYEAQEAPNSGFCEQLAAITKGEFNNKMWSGSN